MVIGYIYGNLMETLWSIVVQKIAIEKTYCSVLDSAENMYGKQVAWKKGLLKWVLQNNGSRMRLGLGTSEIH